MNVLLLFGLIFGSSIAFAQEVGGADIEALLDAIGGLKGGGTLAAVAAVVQALLWLAKGFLKGIAGKYQLLIVMGLNIFAGVVALMMSDVDLGAALLHSSTIGALQVFLHQIYKQFFVKED